MADKVTVEIQPITTIDEAARTLNGHFPAYFVRNATAELFDNNTLDAIAKTIQPGANNQQSQVVLGTLFAGYLAAKRGLSVKEALGYAHLKGALASVVLAEDLQGALDAAVADFIEAKRVALEEARRLGKKADAASKTAASAVSKVVDEFAAGTVPSEAIARVKAARAQLDALLASVTTTV